MEEMRNEPSAAMRKELGKLYGLSENLETPLNNFAEFDMTRFD